MSRPKILIGFIHEFRFKHLKLLLGVDLF